jgi:hypothetical protein
MALFRGRAFLIAAVVVLVILIALVFYFVPLSTLRDLAIIFIAILDIILLAILIAIAFALWRLVDLLRNGLPPLLSSVSRTVATVEGTAEFATTTAVTPLIRGASLLYALSRFVQVLFGRRRREE